MDQAAMKKINGILGFENKKPFAGAFSTIPAGKTMVQRPLKCVYPGKKKIITLDALLDAVELKDGMTVSFHHHLRNGDLVMQKIVKAISDKGIRGLKLSASSLSLVQDAILPYLENGTIVALDSSGLRGKLGAYVQKCGLNTPVMLRSHGGRARAIETGELSIDVAFIAAPCCDVYGNINGIYGPSACGALGYAMPDAEYAKHVVAVTDNLQDRALDYVSIPQTKVDYIVQVESLGDPAGIATGSIRSSKKPSELLIARRIIDAVKYAGLLKDGLVCQFGTGGVSLAAAGFLKEEMLKKGITAAAGVGGVSAAVTEMLAQGLIKTFYDVQDFDISAIESLRNNERQQEISATDYANPFNASPYVNMLDFAVLSATEMDINFNVNVLTDSYGKLMGAPGGHPDASAGSKLAIIAMPLLRGRLPMLLERVQTVVTPGETVDMLVTDYGIAVNPRREDLLNELKKSPLPVMPITDLYEKAMKLAGKPQPVEMGDKICGLVEYRDGTIIDAVYSRAD